MRMRCGDWTCGVIIGMRSELTWQEGCERRDVRIENCMLNTRTEILLPVISKHLSDATPSCFLLAMCMKKSHISKTMLELLLATPEIMFHSTTDPIYKVFHGHKPRVSIHKNVTRESVHLSRQIHLFTKQPPLQPPGQPSYHQPARPSPSVEQHHPSQP